MALAPQDVSNRITIVSIVLVHRLLLASWYWYSVGLTAPVHTCSTVDDRVLLWSLYSASSPIAVAVGRSRGVRERTN
jgi:hypothetical protein